MRPARPPDRSTYLTALALVLAVTLCIWSIVLVVSVRSLRAEASTHDRGLHALNRIDQAAHYLIDIARGARERTGVVPAATQIIQDARDALHAIPRDAEDLALPREGIHTALEEAAAVLEGRDVGTDGVSAALEQRARRLWAASQWTAERYQARSQTLEDAMEQRWRSLLALAIASTIIAGALGSLLLLVRRDAGRRDRINAALMESETRFRQMSDAIKEVFWLLDWQEGKVIYVSSAYTTIWHRSPADLYSEALDWQEAIHEDDRQRIAETFRTQAAAGEYDEEYRIVRPDGSQRWIRDRAFPIRDEAGTVVRIAGIAQDITAQRRVETELRTVKDRLEQRVDARQNDIIRVNRQLREEIAERQVAERALQHERDLLRVLMRQIPEHMYFKDLDGRFTRVNHALARFFGHDDPEAIVGKTDFDFFAPEHAEQFRAAEQRIIRTGEPIRSLRELCPLPSGEERWFTTTKVLVRDGAGRPTGIVGISRDETAAVNATRQLRQREAQFRGVFESNMLGIHFWNMKGDVVDANDAYLDMVGYSREDLKAGRLSWRDLTPERFGHVDNQALHELKTTGVCAPYEKEYICRDGTPVPILLGAAMLEDTEDMGVAFALDLRPLREAQAELHRRDRVLEAVSFAAHEFLQTGDWETHVEEAMRRLGEATGVSRVYIFENQEVDDELFMCQRYEWVAPGVNAVIDNEQLKSLRYTQGFERWAQVLPRGETIYGHVTDFPASERRVLEGLDVKSMVVVPIFVAEKWWGYLGFDECSELRTWSEGEIDALRTSAGTVGAAVQRVLNDRQLVAMNDELELRVEQRTEELGLANQRLQQEVEEHRRTGHALTDVRQRLERITDAIPGAVYQYQLSPEGVQRFTFISAGAEELFGMAPGEITGNFDELWNRIDSDDLPGLIASIERSATSLSPWQHEIRFWPPGQEHAPGVQPKWVRGSSVPEHPREDGTITWNGVFVDITALKEGERKLRQLNDELERRVQVRTAELRESNERLQDENVERRRAQAVQAGRNLVLQRLIQRDSLPDVLRTLLLTATEARPELMGMILILDRETQLLELRAACGVPQEVERQCQGLPLDATDMPSVRSARSGERVVVNHLTESPECAVTLRELARTHGLNALWSEPILSSEGEVLGVLDLLSSASDLSLAKDLPFIRATAQFAGIAIERRRAEEDLRISQERLRVADRLAAIGTLTAGLGHDMSNVLFPIRCHFRAMDWDSVPERLLAPLEAIRDSIEILQQLCADLRLLAADPEDPKAEVTSATALAPWWERVRPLMAHALPKDIELRTQIAPDLPDVNIAPHQLTQAVLNLVVNAAEACREGGKVTVRARASTARDHVTLSVIDDGVGMSETVRLRALDPFYSTKTRSMSTGLGLSIVHGLVSAAGGELQIQSSPDRGTSIEIILPVARAVPSNGVQGPRAALTIADAQIAAWVATVLAKAGFAVRRPDNGIPDDCTLWITDPTTQRLGTIRSFLERGDDRRVIVLGAPEDEWREDDRLEIVDRTEDLNAIRWAVHRVRAALPHGNGNST